MHLNNSLAQAQFQKHFSSILDSEISGWNEIHIKAETSKKSLSINSKIKKKPIRSFFKPRKSVSVEQKYRKLPIPSRYMNPDLYKTKIEKQRSPKSKKISQRHQDETYTYTRKNSISHLEKLMHILETRTYVSNSVQLPKIPKQILQKPPKSPELHKKSNKIFSNTLLRFFNRR